MSTRCPAQVKRTAVTATRVLRASVGAVEQGLALRRRGLAVPEVHRAPAKLQPGAEIPGHRAVGGEDALCSFLRARNGDRDAVRLDRGAQRTELRTARDWVAR